MSTELAKDQEAIGQPRGQTGIGLLIYLLLGICFGITLTKSEVLSWFRIQEMFRFQSPRMYEIIASAVVVAAASVALIKRLGLTTISGAPIDWAVAERWGDLMAQSRRSGVALSVMDGFFAATALAKDLTLVTRNVRDFASFGVSLLNPWDE